MEGDYWGFLTEVMILLGGALGLGLLFERLRQSAILGYLVAGTVLGPNVLGLIEQQALVDVMAELGVALLLFAIGLEFSMRRLLRIGPIGLGGGTLQILLTGALTAGAMWALLPARAAVAVGAMAALSSTACVLRVLTDRTEIDSVHGRNALGILLLQDVAVVPLVLLVTMLGGAADAREMAVGLGRSALLIAGLFAAFFVLINFLLPRLFTTEALQRNRELPILLAVVLALGSAWAAHELGLSPALGAFLAGMMLAESPFALKVRADVGALRTLFVTLFFASIGMLGDPLWMLANGLWVALVVGLLVAGKAAVTAAVTLLFGYTLRHAVATGVVLAQVGEFSFVLAGVAWAGGEGGVIDEYTFRLIVSATLVSLLLTPYLAAGAPWLGRWVERTLGAGPRPALAGKGDREDSAGHRDHVIVVGFGPAGQRVAERMRERGIPVVVIDLHPRNVRLALDMGLAAHLGDASHADLLEHANVAEARAVVLALPDHNASLAIVDHLKLLAPHVPIVARARYNKFAGDIERAGAHAVVDEEVLTGRRLGLEVGRWLERPTG